MNKEVRQMESAAVHLQSKLQKMGSFEGKKISRLQEQAACNSDYLCKNYETPSTYGRGKEFQHNEGVLEIKGERATYSLRFLLASLASLRATLRFELPKCQVKTEALRRMTFGYARCNTPTPTPIHSHWWGKKPAFTLAEVLITLGIIGVVAAMTLPSLVGNYRKKTVETRLKKVYSVMNQAIAQSETVNGPKEYWNFNDSEFVNKYIAPYLNKTEIKILNGAGYNYAAIYFADGSLLIVKTSNYTDSDGNLLENHGMSVDWFFYPNAKNFDMNEFDSRTCVGKSCFIFQFAYELKKGFEPYKSQLPNEFTEEDLRSNANYGCNKGVANPAYCTALIQYNGWEIPDDYPFKF